MLRKLGGALVLVLLFAILLFAFFAFLLSLLCCIRDFDLALRWSGCLPLRWHPRIVSSLHASPLCGAAPTFLCRRKEK
ncbi:hypothetical protein [Paraburkholderia caribensis]|uniref:hypothetical protein n=1 Tax=Paraburkholderia caribensis TaxID=75105 RepID=UPI0015A0E64B|nr:hypothetical protein [Paraburkholderia caribensis]